MPRKKVPIIPGNYYHIYNRAIIGNLLFEEEKNYLFFLEKMEKYLLPAAEIISYCLMPNHYHFILRTATDDISSAMHKLTLSYVVSFNKIYNRYGHLFQGTFRRKQITDSTYLLHLSRYIHLNPVKATLVLKAEDWEYSSYLDYIGIYQTSLINPSPILDLMGNRSSSTIASKRIAYQEFVELWDFNYMEFKGLSPL